MLSLSDKKLITARRRINRFLTSPQYILMIAVLSAFANIFSMELPVYTIYTLLVLYICLFGHDLLPIMPMVICSYIAPSVQNNPGRNAQSMFSSAGGGYWLVALAMVLVVAVIIRIIRNRKVFFGRKYPLLLGMLLLSGAYLVSGIGSKGYSDIVGQNLLFAFLQICAIIVPYLLFSGGVNWKTARKDYFAWIGLCVGGLLVVQLLYIYGSAQVVVDGVIHRKRIFTGWGMYNNMGSLLAMMIPFAFYLATRYRKGWIGIIVGSGFMAGVVLSCSRNAIMVGFAMYIVCMILMLFYARNRRATTITAITLGVVVVVLFSFFYQPLLQLFDDLLNLQNLLSRNSIYADGMKLFGKYPIFGGSFFSKEYTPWAWSTVAEFSNFFPPRWHNTIVQLLASCGIVGLVTYLIHRIQTAKMFAKRHSAETNFIACSVLVLIFCSLFDCHFFNVGPALFYSMALAFAENCKRT